MSPMEGAMPTWIQYLAFGTIALPTYVEVRPRRARAWVVVVIVPCSPAEAASAMIN
jgi:hypothetical protein